MTARTLYRVASFPLRASLGIVAGACMVTGITLFMVLGALASGGGNIKE